jgi:hypothetical protein
MKKRQLVWGMAIILVAALMVLSLTSFDGANSITGLLTDPGDRDMTNVTIVYSVVPITRVEAGYSFDEYEELVSESRELVEECRASADIAVCIADNLGAGWTQAGSEGTFYMFEVTGDQKTRQYDTAERKIIEKNIGYRFALDFS